MPEAYSLEEIRLVQEQTATSAVNALNLWVGTVPQGKIWTVLSAAYMPSVAETQVVSFQKVTRSGALMGLLNPVSLNLNPAVATCIEYGMAIQLYPGEYLYARRVAATAGSTMTLTIQYTESDLPLYDYIEPQVAAKLRRAGTSLAQRVFRAGGGGSVGGAPASGSRGPRGPLPK